MSDTTSVLIWWLTIFFIGISVYPLTRRIFSRFIDKGYIFSKVLGIFILSYTVWFLGMIKVLPFFRESIILTLLVMAAFNLWLFLKKRNPSQNSEEKAVSLSFIFIEEFLFLATLAFWAYIKAHEPSIRGLEKFMDFGFVNSILKSTYFPPLDMWLTKAPDYGGGYFINYYYFGHLVTALLTKLSGIDSIITYNLAIAVLFAFTFTLSFSIGMNLVYICLKSLNYKLSTINYKLILTGGFLAAFIVSLGGNLHTIYAFTTGYPNDNPKPFWQLPFGFHPESYWYPNATRFIPFTIHEFPIYSFVVSDLHGHVSDIPFVLLTLALLLNLLIKNSEAGGRSEGSQDEFHRRASEQKDFMRGKQPMALHTQNQENDQSSELKRILGHATDRTRFTQYFQNFLQEFQSRTSISLPYLLFLSILMAVMYMTNAVDGLIYMILTALVLFYRNGKSVHQLKQTIYQTFSASLFMFFFFLLGSLPFSIFFKPFGTGIGVLCAPAFLLGKHLGPILFEEGKCQKSPIWMLATLWGFFYFNVIGFITLILLPKFKRIITQAGDTSEGSHTKLHIRASEQEDVMNGIRYSSSHNIKSKYDPSSELKRSMGYASDRTREKLKLSITDIFVIATTIISTLLLIFPEFFYIKDIYPMHYRANTMFKFGYQAFIMLGLDSAYIFIRIHLLPKSWKKIIFMAGFAVVFGLIAIYPFFAINSYFGALKTNYGLDGLQWMKREYPQDYDAVVWLRNNITGQPVILEANGESYTDYARVSGNTGLPTVIGWPVHEWLWRGSYDEAGKRIPLVQQLYESSDLNLTRQLIQKYNISYVFVGQLEKQKYPNLDENKWNQLGAIVFQSGSTRIYKINI